MATETGKLSHAYILSAPSAREQERMALRLAQTAVCTDPLRAPCGVCAACRKVGRGVHPDVSFVRRLKDDKGRPRREIVVDQIRALAEEAWVRPNEAARRVFIIEDADRMNAAAQNAALKLFEDPPGGAVFLLCAANPGLLLPTVRSRCVERSAASAEADGPGEEALQRAEDFLRLAGEGRRERLLKGCVTLEGMEPAAAGLFFEALSLHVTDALCGRCGDFGLDRRQLSELAALAGRCSEALKVNVSVKHLLGLLAVDSPLGRGNRG